MPFNQLHLLTGEKAHQEALSQNLQEEIIGTDEFNTFANTVHIQDSGMKLVLAMSFVDKSLQKMNEHNEDNYERLAAYFTSAITLLNSEFEQLIAYISTTGYEENDVIKKLLVKSHIQLGVHPIKTFCEERDNKDVLHRANDIIESLYSAVRTA